MDIGTILFWIYVIVGIGILAAFCIWYFYVRKFNKIVHVIIEGRNSSKLIITKARLVIDKNNLAWWELQGLKDHLQAPSKEELFITSKGKECATCIKKGDLDYQWVRLIDMPQEKKVGYGSLSQQSKMNYAYQFRKHLQMQQNNFGELIKQMAPYIMLVIIAIIGLMMYDSVGKHAAEAASSAAAAADSVEKASELLAQAQLIVNANLANRTVAPILQPLK